MYLKIQAKVLNRSAHHRPPSLKLMAVKVIGGRTQLNQIGSCAHCQQYRHQTVCVHFRKTPGEKSSQSHTMHYTALLRAVKVSGGRVQLR